MKSSVPGIQYQLPQRWTKLMLTSAIYLASPSRVSPQDPANSLLYPSASGQHNHSHRGRKTSR